MAKKPSRGTRSHVTASQDSAAASERANGLLFLLVERASESPSRGGPTHAANSRTRIGSAWAKSRHKMTPPAKHVQPATARFPGKSLSFFLLSSLQVLRPLPSSASPRHHREVSTFRASKSFLLPRHPSRHPPLIIHLLYTNAPFLTIRLHFATRLPPHEPGRPL